MMQTPKTTKPLSTPRLAGARAANVSPLHPRGGPAKPGVDKPPAVPVASESLRITVIGTGYVGLVSAACFASFGHQVTGFDIDRAKVAALQRAEVSMHEAGLRDLVAEELARGRLAFTDDAATALDGATLVFVAVGTPAREDGSVMLDAVEQVGQLLRERVQAPTVVVMKSTVPVGTAATLQALLARGRVDGEVELVPAVLSNPEFLREGSAVQDFLAPDRIIIGCDGTAGRACEVLAMAYAPLLAAGVPRLDMDTRSAELAKAAANAMLAARISFINEIAAIAEATGADIERVCEGIGSDRRIGPKFLGAGLGYGGSCFPKDVSALRHTARLHQLRADVLAATERVNGRQRCWPLEALRRDLGGWAALRGLRVAIWGLAFKPGTDDMREAPSLMLIERLRRAGAHVALYDPVAMTKARALLPSDHGVRWSSSAADALDGSDVLLLVTEWPEFLAFPPAQAASALRLATVFDGRNALDDDLWSRAGVRLFQVGRPGVGRTPLRRPASGIEFHDELRSDAWILGPFAAAAS